MKITEQDLDSIIVPQVTDTYQPVAHSALLKQVRKIGNDMFQSEAINSTLVANSKGSQIFGTLVYPRGDDETSLSIGFRNSYDKSLAVGICSGAQIMVCSNLAFHGDITTFRKHTSGVHDDLELMILEAIGYAKTNYQVILDHSEMFRKEEVDDRLAASLLGQMFVNDGIINTVQINKAKQEWHKPTHKEFAPRNAWSLYNCCTEALKSAHPSEAMQQYLKLHEFFIERCN